MAGTPPPSHSAANKAAAADDATAQAEITAAKAKAVTESEQATAAAAERQAARRAQSYAPGSVRGRLGPRHYRCSVQNIQSLIHVTLDVNSGNYTRWRDQFLLAVGKFSLQEHVLSDEASTGYPDWACMDCVVKSWIFSTISDDLAKTISVRGSTARAAWLAVEYQFLDNRETRALYLDAKFCSFSQGDLSITDYCCRLKQMADDLGETVTDRQGRTALGGALAHQSSTPTTFVASQSSSLAPVTTGGGESPGGGGAGHDGAPPSSKGCRGKHGDKKGGSGQPGPGGKGPQTASGAPWPTYWNPWTGTIQMWPGPRPPLAPIPQPRPSQQQQAQQQAQQHALLASSPSFLAPQQVQQVAPAPLSAAQWAPPTPGSYNPIAGLPSWDQQSLASTFSTMTLSQP
ncbi:uncharacterized protein LOC120643099 [Panicum virgatum]|uniref:uncharacterized protein LOC120643099 n=1 Tax=Panicum virgatum TaxID=38727 RepID=UPI0019D69043|nr:uncharacterized protein LOC120643099 [Panicum virgatum]